MRFKVFFILLAVLALFPVVFTDTAHAVAVAIVQVASKMLGASHG